MYKLICFVFFSHIGFGQSAIEKTQSFMEAKKYVMAQQEIQNYLELNPKSIRAIELLGDSYAYQRKWDRAIEQYKKLKENYPNNANYHYKYGGALGMKARSISKFKALGIIGDIKQSFLTASSLDKSHIDTRWALVDLYVSLPGIVGGSYAKALKYAEELEKLSKVDGYLAKGYVYEYDNEPELAEKYYKLAIKVGGSVTCYEKLSNFYDKQKRPDKALGTLEISKEKHQRNAIHYQIGKVCAEYNIQLDKGEKSLAVYLANYSAKDGVPKEWAYYRLAQINRHKNDKSNALFWIEKAITGLPNIDVFHSEQEAILKL
ncbi:tetratricopeptide repeat protein [Winogradskyella alexanderae]|uniref:Tetratricopeptide repeat protein n=1 Tax=Winogradskyella alexanderae TaxID=2877123 RepID=A0ABS7XU96_9FLAO|nr:tetratricopeptide repeat protein [Winogradskyella alexanderae]MCA0133602.1 tetratricopeptide repeat protein [Winogradskyella alexanderae]